jgi:predicted P-loop ATPase/GTPase
MLGQEDRQFAVDRVAENFVVNDTVDVPAEARDHLPLDDAIRVDSLSTFNDVMSQLHVVALDGIARRIAERDRAVVESYGDIARPLRDIDPDAVAVVEPGRARVYDGERYGKACQVATGGPEEGQLEERVPNVVELIDAEGAVPLPALSSDERADPATVAAAYDEAYDALLAVADA